LTAPKVKPKFTVGTVYTTDGTDLWRCTHYTPEPFVEMEPIGDGVKMDGVESKFAHFVRLVPEVDPPKRPHRKYERKTWPEIPDGEGIKSK
jgi:hypothetical protein